MDRKAWWAADHKVTESETWLSNYTTANTHTHTHFNVQPVGPPLAAPLPKQKAQAHSLTWETPCTPGPLSPRDAAPEPELEPRGCNSGGLAPQLPRPKHSELALHSERGPCRDARAPQLEKSPSGRESPAPLSAVSLSRVRLCAARGPQYARPPCPPPTPGA